MTAVAPYRSELGAGRDGFAQLLRAEWTKFRTVRGWLVALVVGGLLIVGLGVLTGAGSVCSENNRACPTPPAGPGGEWVTDSFYFVHQPLGQNGTLTVRVTSLTGLYSTHGGLPAAGGSPTAGMTPGIQPWSKAGIIIKAGTAPGSAYAAMMVTGTHGARMQWDFTGDTPGLAGKVSAASPRWLRLTRAGDVIRGYDSADGAHWTLVGTVTLAGLPVTAQAGLFATTPGYSQASHSLGTSAVKGGPALATGTFDDVSRQGSWPAGFSGRWAGQAVHGSSDDALLGPAQGFTRAAGRFTVTGAGDIAPKTDNPGTIGQVLTGTFAGLIVMVVIGVMFVTAEYRRGLILTTFTASPRRGRVLAAKAVVLAAVTFVTALAAILIVIPLGEHLLRENGNPVYPLTALTAVRIVGGTAALLAVAAVLALAVGTLLRRSAGAVTAVIAGIVLPYLLGVLPGVLPPGAQEWLLRLTPAAAFAIQQDTPQYAQVLADYSPGNGYFPLGPWAGFAVLCAWAVLALVLATYALRRRDA
jgi:ABC-type transport system involved in multi-copper enzyme maturation permease subunit